jgi:hypothetical protein
LVYFVTIWYILWIFGMLYQKIWQPWSQWCCYFDNFLGRTILADQIT